MRKIDGCWICGRTDTVIIEVTFGAHTEGRCGECLDLHTNRVFEMPLWVKMCLFLGSAVILGYCFQILWDLGGI